MGPARGTGEAGQLSVEVFANPACYLASVSTPASAWLACSMMADGGDGTIPWLLCYLLALLFVGLCYLLARLLWGVQQAPRRNQVVRWARRGTPWTRRSGLTPTRLTGLCWKSTRSTGARMVLLLCLGSKTA